LSGSTAVTLPEYLETRRTLLETALPAMLPWDLALAQGTPATTLRVSATSRTAMLSMPAALTG